VHSKIAARAQEPIAAAEPTEFLATEIERLPKDHCLAEKRRFWPFTSRRQVRCPGSCWKSDDCGDNVSAQRKAQAKAGIWTAIDQHYWQVLLWHKTSKNWWAHTVLEHCGKFCPNGCHRTLYQHSVPLRLRKFSKKNLVRRWSWRSFVRLEYQRQYAPCCCCGRGSRGCSLPKLTLRVVCAVSISMITPDVARKFIYRFFEARNGGATNWLGLIEPRRPFRPPD